MFKKIQQSTTLEALQSQFNEDGCVYEIAIEQSLFNGALYLPEKSFLFFKEEYLKMELLI